MTNPAALPPVYAPLEPSIAPLVEAMRRSGFPTSDSGCGQGETWLGTPWVNVACDGSGRLAVGIMRAFAVRWLRAHGVVANVCEVHTTLEGEPAFPFIRIEVFSDLAEARL